MTTDDESTEQEQAIQEWFRQAGFRVKLEIGKQLLSTDSEETEWVPNHEEKFAVVYKVQNDLPVFFRRYKMPPEDTANNSLKRVKELLQEEAKDTSLWARDAISAHVIPKLKTCHCPVCSSIDWRIGDSIFEMRSFFGQVGSNQIIPVVLATCHICGYILPFNAIHVGAVKQTGELLS